MGAVHLAPLVVQRHDLGHLVLEQTMHRAAPGPAVGQLAERSVLDPAPGPTRAQALHTLPVGSSRRRWPRRGARAWPPWWPRRVGSGLGHCPGSFSLDQHELRRPLLEGFAQAGGIGPGCFELEVPLRRRPARSGARQGLQRPFLGHGADAHDDRAVHLPGLGRLGHGQLLADELQEDLVLLRGAQAALGAPSRSVGSSV